MKRRDFLAAGIAFSELVAFRTRLAVGRTKLARAAVVIGVNKTGTLPVLNAAVSGARMVAEWLENEEFDVELFVDENDPVTISQISDAIEHLVEKGTLDQLVIYFSGHGFLNGSEFWMLSKAPDNSNEAVRLVESVALARQTAIPSIVFISDACRSTPDSLQATQVGGSVIFPNRPSRSNVIPEVDQFLATLPGNPALEIPVADAVARYEGIYTACFLSAFEHPDGEMVATLDGLEVVPNRNLKNYLLREVRRKAEARSIQLHQQPDSRVESGDSTYIGRVARPMIIATPPSPPVITTTPPSPPVPTTTPPSPTPSISPTLFDVFERELDRAGFGRLVPSTEMPSEAKIENLYRSTGYGVAQEIILSSRGQNGSDLQTGFTVNGANVTVAMTTRDIQTKIVDEGDGSLQPATIRVDTADHLGASVGIGFGDGSGTVIAAIRNYVGTVVVDNGRVVNVSYIPSENSPEWGLYNDSREYVDKLRSLVATAAQFGAFRIEGERGVRLERASQLANKIRQFKSVDPTLGLYAAYAYAEADIVEQVKSVRSYMRETLGVDIFDVAMLAGVLSGRDLVNEELPIPVCPMLSQGWNLLRIRDVRLPQSIGTARDYLRPALWTTFDPRGMEIIAKAFKEGGFI